MKRFAIILSMLLCAISATGQTLAAKAEPRYAVVGLSSIYMRIAPDYESALETQELMGSVVEIVGEKSYWREIISPQPYKAWCTRMGLVEMNKEQFEEYQNAAKCMFVDLYGHVYETPSCEAQTICDLVGGDIMRLVGKGKAENFKPVTKGSWTKVLLPSGAEGWVKSECIKRHNGFRSIAKGEGNADSISDELMEKIIATAFKLKGVPYLWGGMTPKGVDCSGMVRWSHLMNGILLPRNASQMIHCGDEVSLDSLQRGDLVFFGNPAKDGKPQLVTHVGLYIGNGQIIHSSMLVRVNSMNPAESNYYENSHRLIAARRL